MMQGAVGGANQGNNPKKNHSQGAGGHGVAKFQDASQATLDVNGVPLYGLDKELAEKAAAKYDHALEAEVRAWIEAVTGERMGSGSFQQELKSGAVLCTLVNAIKPGVCKKPSSSGMAFKQMENIGNYLAAATELGVPQISSFQTVSLYEGKDMGAVLINLRALGSAAQRVPGFDGPTLGARLAEENTREFSEAQLQEAKSAGTFFMQGSTASAAPGVAR